MKDKVVKYWPHIFICIFSIAIGQTVVYFINKGAVDSQFITDLITRIIDILIAILNFSVVIFIFKMNVMKEVLIKKKSIICIGIKHIFCQIVLNILGSFLII